ncbi:MAG: hypothetical protein N2489_06490 [Clostridia bacterium]|nr:hypothetical protein [Clostridia bacterium]
MDMHPSLAPCPLLKAARQSNSSHYLVLKETPVYLGRKPGTERIIIYISNIGIKSLVQIQSYNESTMKWEVAYQKETEGILCYEVINGYLEAVKNNLAVIYYRTGSCACLHYTVVGRKKQNHRIHIR